MTHVIRQSFITRAALLSLWLTVAAFALFSFTPHQTTAAQTATAQPAATPQLYTVRVTHVKPSMNAEFQQLVQNEFVPAHKKGGVKQRSVWTTATLGVAYEYITVTPLEGVKQFDETSALNKALGEAGARALNNVSPT